MMYEYSKQLTQSLFATAARQKLAIKKIVLLTFLLATVLSGCSVLANSENYYREHPLGLDNWREYTE
jgi:hypothetical protein